MARSKKSPYSQAKMELWANRAFKELWANEALREGQAEMESRAWTVQTVFPAHLELP
jgi:hypothetical protein